MESSNWPDASRHLQDKGETILLLAHPASLPGAILIIQPKHTCPFKAQRTICPNTTLFLLAKVRAFRPQKQSWLSRSIMNPKMSSKNPCFQRRNALFFAAIFLAFSGAFWYNFQMSNRIEIALENVSKNSAFGRLNSALESASPALPAREIDSMLRPLLSPLVRNCERAATTTHHSSGFGAALRRNACAALLRQPGTHPRRLRSAAF
jgi:hypothetical protein